MSVDTSPEALKVEKLQALRVLVGDGCIITAFGTLNDMNTLCVHLSTLDRRVEEADRVFVPSASCPIIGDYMTRAELVDAFVALRRQVEDLANDRAAADAEAAKLRERADAAEAQMRSVGIVPYFDRMKELADARDSAATQAKNLQQQLVEIAAVIEQACADTRVYVSGLARPVDRLKALLVLSSSEVELTKLRQEVEGLRHDVRQAEAAYENRGKLLEKFAERQDRAVRMLRGEV